MARRSGSADLPLHSGPVPKWLADRMTRLGVLKRGLTALARELGVHVCGGRGSHSRQTPHELAAIGERVGFDGSALAKASRLVAKVDSAALQGGFDLYLHSFIVTDDGRWVVAQQGMNGERKQPRRYHWLSEGLKSFVEEPHTAIDGLDQGVIVNLTDARAESSRRDQVGMLRSLGPDKIAHELSRLQTSTDRRVKAVDPEQPTLPHLVMPAHHDVSPGDVLTRRACTVIQPPPRNADPPILPNCYWFPELGREPCALLAMVAEVLHGAPYRFSDPARFSFALGGKDRHPFPVRVHVYDQTIRVLKSAAKLGRDEELGTLKRLDEQSRRLERFATGTTVDALVSLERRESHLLGGRSVFGWEQAQSDRTGAN